MRSKHAPGDQRLEKALADLANALNAARVAWTVIGGISLLPLAATAARSKDPTTSNRLGPSLFGVTVSEREENLGREQLVELIELLGQSSLGSA